MEAFLQDLRYAFRMLLRSPGFTVIALLTLALAIGANTAMFSAINALLLNPYPFPDSDRIVLLDARHVSGNNSATGYRDFLDWREQNTVFEEMAIEPWIGAYTLSGNGEPRRLFGGATTPDFLNVMGVQPIRGRFFSPDEDKTGAPRVAVLSYAAWQRDFAGAENVLGRTMVLDGRSVTIIGIMPKQFIFPGVQTFDFLEPLRESASGGRTQHQYEVVARLKPGVDLAHAQANMTVIAQRLAQEYPATNTGWGVSVLPLRQALAADARVPMLILFSAALFVLLLACANLAGLLLARASGRAREMAIRGSLGAGRWQIVRQLLTESALLSLCGGAAGLIFANWLMDILRRAAPEQVGLDTALRLDSTVLIFTLLLSLGTGIVFGLAPAWFGSRTNLNAALKGDPNAWSGARSRNRFQSSLVTGQVALSVVLLIVAGLLIRDLFVVMRIQIGLRVENVLTFALDPPSSNYATEQRDVALYQHVITELQRVPGVQGAAAVGTLPMTGGFTGGAFEIEGRPKAPDWVDTLVQYNTTTSGYFQTIGIPLLRGRDFDERDAAEAAPVAIINDTLARRFFPDDDPIGHRFKDDYDGKWRTIVGVVGSIKNQQPMKPPVPGFYAPYPQKTWSSMWVVVRAAGDPVKLSAAARSIVRGTDPNLLVLHLRTMKQIVTESMAQPELLALFITCFAFFALVLATIGIYGILAYSVSRSLHEMGIRMALGATREDILRLVLRRGAIVTGIGLALGIPLALGLSGTLRSLLYGTSARDMLVFTTVPLLIIAVALAASYFPARRAARVDPNVALRYE